MIVRQVERISGLLIWMVVAGSLPTVTVLAAKQDGALPSIRWADPAPPGGAIAVRVVDVPPALGHLLASAPATDLRWPTYFAVQLVNPDGSAGPDRPALAGKYRWVDRTTVGFIPLFPLDPARRYRATFDPDGPAGSAPMLVADHAAILATPAPPSTVVQTVEPVGVVLPANVLRFYVHFSAPMGRGDAYTHLQLTDSAGRPLDHPFLELGEELWNPTHTRLTVLLDPGRIKRGLRPHEELGPIFVAGRSYTLKVAADWPDASGQPLTAPASKTFTTGPTDETSPDPKTWQFISPRAGTIAPLIVRFDDVLDRATVASGLTVLDPNGTEVTGTATAHPEGTGWQLTPSNPWTAGTYTLAINPDLEDLAGNSIRRPFEVDVQRDVPIVPEVTQIRLSIKVGP